MTQALTPIRRLYHRARGTTKPSLLPLGMYPFDHEHLVFRFEASLLQSLDEAERPRISMSVDGSDAGDRCILLNESHIVIGGHHLVHRDYSLQVPRDTQSIRIDLTGRSGKNVAMLDLNRTDVETLLAEFESLILNASDDSRYQMVAFPAPESSSSSDGKFTVIIAAPEPDASSVLDTVESLTRQKPVSWKAAIAASEDSLNVVVDIVKALNDERVTHVPANDHSFASALNGAIRSAAEGPVLFMRQGDALAPHALARFACQMGNADLAYCDTDCMTQGGQDTLAPKFKPDFNRDLLYSQSYIGTCFAIGDQVLRGLGSFPVTLDEAWDYELALKVSELNQSRMVHIPEVLCHEPLQGTLSGKDNSLRRYRQQRKALTYHLRRREIVGTVEPTRFEGIFRTVALPPADMPGISIIIPNKDHVDYLKPCIDSIREKAGYLNYEIVVIENNSTQAETFSYYERIMQEDTRVRIVYYDGPFNYSKIINYGVRATTSPLLLLLNNDTRVITDDFLSVLTGYFTRPEVGVVGPRLLFPDGLVQHAGMALLQSGRMGFINQNLSPGLHEGYLGSLASAASCSSVLGACQMMRRATFDQVGGYHEDLAITCNDIDFCWKVRRAGLEVVYTPHVELYHKEFGSRNSDVATREQEEQSTREYELMTNRWPECYANGDGFINPNLDRESIYFKLGGEE